jgi:predicted SprT family Zn-dependent metalloprotease
VTKTIGKFDRSVQVWVNAALKKMGATNLVDKLKWVWNPRLTSTMGRAHLLHFPRFLSGEDWWMPKWIEISVPLFEKATPAQRRWLVYHEVAHAVDGYHGTYDPSKPHGKSWKNLMREAGVDAKRCHDVPVVRRGG